MMLPARAASPQPGAEFRGYPSGEIATATLATDLGHELRGELSAGYDFAQRGNNGKHDDEHGGGPGFGVTLDKYFRPGQRGWFVGARSELYFLRIHYRDRVVDGDAIGNVFGSSDVVVLQPTARGGYGWSFAQGRYALALGVSAGAEINVHTHGESVGQGAILLGGFGFSFKP